MKKLISTIAIIIIALLTNAQSKITIGGNLNYGIATSAQKKATAPLMFLKNSQSVGLDFLYTNKKSKVGLKTTLEYFTGGFDNTASTAYAKEKQILASEVKWPKSKHSGVVISTGPSIALFPNSKKMPLMWLDIKAGAIFTGAQSATFYDGTTIVKTVKHNATSFAYSSSVNMVMYKTSKIMVNLRAGYSNTDGVSIGLGIAARNCTGFPCWKCNGAYCNNPKKVTQD